MARKLAYSLAAALLALAGAARAQDTADLDKKIFDRIGAKASERVVITLTGDMLKLAGQFLSGEDADDVKLKKIINNLKSVTVRSYEFKKGGEYTATDLDEIRHAMRTPEWSRIVDVEDKDDHEHTEIYLLPGRDKPQGVFIMAAEPSELTVVQVLGPIDLSDLRSLHSLGVPDIDAARAKSHQE